MVFSPPSGGAGVGEAAVVDRSGKMDSALVHDDEVWVMMPFIYALYSDSKSFRVFNFKPVKPRQNSNLATRSEHYQYCL